MDVDNEDDEHRPVAAETLREAYHSVRVRRLATTVFVYPHSPMKYESEPLCVGVYLRVSTYVHYVVHSFCIDAYVKKERLQAS